VEFITDERMQYLRSGKSIDLNTLEKFVKISL